MTLIALLVMGLPYHGRGADPAPIKPPSASLVQRLVTPTETIAKVGDQTVFAGDLLPTIDRLLEDVIDQIPPDQRDQLDRQRALYVQQLLPRKIEVKLVLLDFYRTIPADKLDEVLGNIDKQVEKQFYDEQVPALQKQYEVEFLKDLDSRLRSFGSSMQMEKAAFREQMIARTMISQNVNRQPEITHRELLDYYYEHVDDYKIEARARWEKLTVLFEKFPDKAAADRAICDMGNQVVRGAKFAAVAEKFSQGTNALQGGLHDWTTKGALVSDVLDDAIFSIPVYQLSPILTDERGFHIIRVLEREDARQISFEEAQDGIRKKLQEQHREKDVQKYLAELRNKTYVWTILDET